MKIVLIITDKYVVIGGTGNGTESNPMGSIRLAINISVSGETIFVGPGLWGAATQDINLFQIGGASNIYVVATAGPANTTLTINGASSVWTIKNINNITIDGFQMKNSIGNAAQVLLINNAKNIVLKNSWIVENGFPINNLIVIDNSTLNIENCIFSNNNVTAVNASTNSVVNINNTKVALHTSTYVFDIRSRSTFTFTNSVLSSFGSSISIRNTNSTTSASNSSFFLIGSGGYPFLCSNPVSSNYANNLHCGQTGSFNSPTCPNATINSALHDSCYQCGGTNAGLSNSF